VHSLTAWPDRLRSGAVPRLAFYGSIPDSCRAHGFLAARPNHRLFLDSYKEVIMDFLKTLGIEVRNPGAHSGVGWSKATDTDVLDVHNPATGEFIAQVNVCTEQDYETVVENAQAAFDEWRTVPAPRRGEMVRLITEELRAKKDALGSLVSLEVGKIKAEGDGEVQEMIDIGDFAVGQSRMLYGKTMHSERPQHRMYEQWHPLGLVGVITAFNFPVAVYSWNALIAAIAGNVVIWKPSPKAPLTSIAVQNICNGVMETMGYRGIFSLIVATAPSAVSDRFINDKRIPLISFTGSTAVGRHVAQVVAGRLGKTILEMGGNNAIVVDETADMELAIPAIAFGAVGTAGQRCTTTRRIIVHESRYDELSKRLVAAYKQVPIGNPLDPGVLLGPLIDQRAVADYKAAIEEAKAEGGEVLYGGNVKQGPGNFVEPTIIRAQNEWPLVQRETFAPILYVMTYKTLDEAIALHNGVPQGLSSALFTQSMQNGERFLSALGSDCGIANINIGTSGAEIGGAFGGEKETGGGREAGSDAWKAYMRRQTTTINWGSELPLAQGIDFSL
jgi:aldehyde dehydrogenase (NAD+)